MQLSCSCRFPAAAATPSPPAPESDCSTRDQHGAMARPFSQINHHQTNLIKRTPSSCPIPHPLILSHLLKHPRLQTYNRLSTYLTVVAAHSAISSHHISYHRHRLARLTRPIYPSSPIPASHHAEPDLRAGPRRRLEAKQPPSVV